MFAESFQSPPRYTATGWRDRQGVRICPLSPHRVRLAEYPIGVRGKKTKRRRVRKVQANAGMVGAERNEEAGAWEGEIVVALTSAYRRKPSGYLSEEAAAFSEKSLEGIQPSETSPNHDTLSLSSPSEETSISERLQTSPIPP